MLDLFVYTVIFFTCLCILLLLNVRRIVQRKTTLLQLCIEALAGCGAGCLILKCIDVFVIDLVNRMFASCIILH